MIQTTPERGWAIDAGPGRLRHSTWRHIGVKSIHHFFLFFSRQELQCTGHCYWQNQKTGRMYTKLSLYVKNFLMLATVCILRQNSQWLLEYIHCEDPLGIWWTCLCQCRAFPPENPQKEKWYIKSKGVRLETVQEIFPGFLPRVQNFRGTTGCFLSLYLSIFTCMAASTARILGALSLWTLHIGLMIYWASLLRVPLTGGANSTSRGPCSHSHPCTLHPANMATITLVCASSSSRSTGRAHW